jgi:hypothetical protein
VSLLLNALCLRPCYDIDALLATHPVFTDMPGGTAECFLAGMLDYFTRAATRPPPPGLVGLRQFQRDHGIAAIGWLRSRLGD